MDGADDADEGNDADKGEEDTTLSFGGPRPRPVDARPSREERDEFGPLWG